MVKCTLVGFHFVNKIVKVKNNEYVQNHIENKSKRSSLYQNISGKQ